MVRRRGNALQRQAARAWKVNPLPGCRDPRRLRFASGGRRAEAADIRLEGFPFHPVAPVRACAVEREGSKGVVFWVFVERDRIIEFNGVSRFIHGRHGNHRFSIFTFCVPPCPSWKNVILPPAKVRRVFPPRGGFLAVQYPQSTPWQGPNGYRILRPSPSRRLLPCSFCCVSSNVPDVHQPRLLRGRARVALSRLSTETSSGPDSSFPGSLPPPLAYRGAFNLFTSDSGTLSRSGIRRDATLARSVGACRMGGTGELPGNHLFRFRPEYSLGILPRNDPGAGWNNFKNRCSRVYIASAGFFSQRFGLAAILSARRNKSPP